MRLLLAADNSPLYPEIVNIKLLAPAVVVIAVVAIAAAVVFAGGGDDGPRPHAAGYEKQRFSYDMRAARDACGYPVFPSAGVRH